MLKKFLILAMIFFSCSVKAGEIYFPGIDARDLNKDEFNIPNNLSSEFNIFILSLVIIFLCIEWIARKQKGLF